MKDSAWLQRLPGVRVGVPRTGLRHKPRLSAAPHLQIRLRHVSLAVSITASREPALQPAINQRRASGSRNRAGVERG